VWWYEDDGSDHGFHSLSHWFGLGFDALRPCVCVSEDALCHTLVIPNAVCDSLSLGPVHLPDRIAISCHNRPPTSLGLYSCCIHGCAGDRSEYTVYTPDWFFIGGARHCFKKVSDTTALGWETAMDRGCTDVDIRARMLCFVMEYMLGFATLARAYVRYGGRHSIASYTAAVCASV